MVVVVVVVVVAVAVAVAVGVAVGLAVGLAVGVVVTHPAWLWLAVVVILLWLLVSLWTRGQVG